MKKIIASLAAGMIIAGAVPALAAEAGNRAENNRPGYCWQAEGAQPDDGYCYGRQRRGGRGGCYWGNPQNNE